MVSQPLVSIIIPTYNRAHLIGETLDSVLAQTYTNWECIIVDDGSSDNTDEVIETYLKKDERFKYFHRPDIHKPGGNGARNYGFLQSKGEYVNWFDSDDVMHPQKLERQVIPLHESDYNFAVCQTLVFEGNIDNIIGLRHEKIISNDVLFDFITHNIIFLTQAPIFKYSFLKTYRLHFDEELKAAQEWELICRVLYYSPKYLVDNIALVYIRKHQNSISYDFNNGVRGWHYYLARKKVFEFLKDKKIPDKKSVYDYFRNYFSNRLKNYLFKKEVKKSLQMYNQSVRPFYGFIANGKIMMYMVFVLFTGKGYRSKDKYIK